MTDQQKAELAMEFFGLWKHGERCEEPSMDTRFDIPDPLRDDAVAMRLFKAFVAEVGWPQAQLGIWRAWCLACHDDERTGPFDEWLPVAIVRAAAVIAEQKKGE